MLVLVVDIIRRGSFIRLCRLRSFLTAIVCPLGFSCRVGARTF